MKSKFRVVRIISVILTFCMVITSSFFNSTVLVRAEGRASVNPSKLYGVWTGYYVGSDGNTEIKRAFRLDIDYSVDGVIEGIATIDDGKNGSYFFEGRIDLESGDIRFEGSDWIDNPNGFSFSSFSGKYNEKGKKIEGIADGEEVKPFSLTKQSDKYTTRRIKYEDVPKDWQGEYDGTDGNKVVRRDYEIHIQNIDSEGNIKGTAIISPSEKAEASLGANGSYFFSGVIDERKGKIRLQGNEWIDYPATSNYLDWEFVKLNGFFDLKSSSINGESEEGIWEMKAINYDSIKKLSGFKLERDNNSFVNTMNKEKYDAAGFANVSDYTIDDTYFEKLTKNSSEGEKNKIKKDMKEEWDGACYGMSMSMGLLYEGYIDISDLSTNKASNYHSLDYPCNDKKLLNMIHYYQLSQNLEKGGKQSAAVSYSFNGGIFSGPINLLTHYDSLSVFLKKLVNHCDNEHVELMGATTSDGCHAVLITGCEFDKSLGKYKVQIYDENCILSKDDKGSFSYMYIEKDFSNFEYADAGLNKKTYKAIYFLDWNSLGSVVSNTASGYSGHTKIDFPMDQKFKVEDESGNYLKYDGEKLSGNIKIFDIFTIDCDNISRFVIEIANTSKLKISEIGSKLDLNVTTESNFMSVEGTSIKTASINFDDGVKVEGENAEYKIYVTTDNISANEKGLTSVAGKTKSEVSVSPDGSGVTVETDGNLSDIKTETFVGANVVKKTFSKVGKKFTIDKNAKVSTVKPSLTKASVKLSNTSYVYNGKAKKPSVTVKLNGKKLKKGRDYTVTYKNNKKVGTASVVITGKGNYIGKITKKFKIVPKGTTLTKVLGKKKQIGVKWKKQTKLTTGYQIQYSTSKKFKGAKTQTITKNKKTSCIIKKLKSKKKYYVRVRTYKKVKGKKYYSKWSKVKSVKTK